MAKQGLIRCVSIATGKVRYLIPLLANNATRLKKLGFVNAEIEAPKVKEPKKKEKVLKPVTENPAPPIIPEENPLIES